MALLDAIFLGGLLWMLLRYGERCSQLTRLPSITLFLLAGACGRACGAFSEATVSSMLPLHHAMLAVITFAAGSELEIESLRANFALLRSLTLCLTASALTCVFSASLLLSLLVAPHVIYINEQGDDVDSMTLACVSSMLAAVVAIARSPSSAIGVVSQVRADGPFTQTVLSVTMVTDVVVIVLFTAAVEIADVLLSPQPDGSGYFVVVLGRFCVRTAVHLALSSLHALVLTVLCLAALRLPTSPAILRPSALLAAGAFAFGAERGLHLLTHGGPLDEFIRLEPMLGCICCGFALCNFCGRRRAFAALLQRCMPWVLCFFFTTTGIAMDLSALAQTWPLACGLVAARMASLRIGYASGVALAPVDSDRVPPNVRGSTAWLAYITQAGVGLGLAEEIAERFSPWGADLRTVLVASIVLNQIGGPPLLKYALRASGEAGKLAVPVDKLAEQLARQQTNQSTANAIFAAAAAAATMLAPSTPAAEPNSNHHATPVATPAGAGAPSAAASVDERDDQSTFSLAWLRSGADLFRHLRRRVIDGQGDDSRQSTARKLFLPA